MTKDKTKDTAFSRFLIIWFGQLSSSIGSGLTAFALGVYVFHLTGSAANYSLILLAAFLPSFLLKPIGGAIADRTDRRLMMVIGDAGAILGVVFIIILISLGVKSLWPIYTGSVISSIFVALQNPAYKASVTDLLDEKSYSKGSGLVQLAESSKFIISPLVAGLLLSIMNIKGVLIIDCLTFGIAIITVLWVKQKLNKKHKTDTNEKFINDFISGFKYTFSHKSLIILLCIISLVTFFIGILQGLLGPMILAVASAKVFGASQTIAAIGLLISSLLIGIFDKSTKKITLLSISLFFSGIFFALMGVSPNIIIITIFAFLFFLTLPFVNTSLDVLVRRNVANNMQGRVWSIVSLISQLGMVIAFAAAGFIADHIFNPLLLKNGALASSIGEIIGVGPCRGIGLIYIISGIFIAIIAVIINKLQILRKLDD